MNVKRILLISLIAVAIIASASAVSAMHLEKNRVNVSSELKPTDGDDLQFEDNNGICLRIIDENLGNMNNGFSKHNNTIFMFNESRSKGSLEIHSFAYGEYIKIDEKKYWIEVSDHRNNPDYEKCLEYLEYFNKHNNFEYVDV